MEKTRQSKSSWASARGLLTAAALGAMASVSPAQQLEGPYRLNGSAVLQAFEPLREVLQSSSAVLLDDWKSFAYGLVVSPDGYVLTKASELADRDEMAISIGASKFTDVEVLATDVEWDVALLKVDAENLTPVVWKDGEEVTIGSWVVSNGSTSRSRRRARVGIISANAREIKGSSNVVLGIVLKTEKDQIVVEDVKEDTGAAEAGLQSGDVIVEAEGKKMEKREDLLDLLGDKEPGDILKVRVDRDGEEMDFEVELMERHRVFDGPQSRNDAMSGRFSGRRENFPRVIQHDIMLSERSVGGPLLDLEGRCVGMNIARANRSETFAIPAAEVQAVLERLLEDSR
ncbi:MAG: PDZ domain-containing protein [Akkermansiaceae bacterium]|nr:PDZ domain-containing protein [Akkermansiaceae bacterium]NNM29517.1 PDZ domain-containing protein [Akkermansiaceae bacterium]